MLKVASRTVYRLLETLLLLGVIIFGGTVVALRYWVLPDIGEYKDFIATQVSTAVKRPVSIGDISADWDGLRPRFLLRDVALLDADGRPALTLGHVENTMSWWSLVFGEVRFYNTVIERPVLTIRRDPAGVVYVGGVALGEKHDGGFGDWVLQQRSLRVRDATLLWVDEQRGAPPLVLKHVGLRMENRGQRHRLGLKASPPGSLSGPVVVIADLRGETVAARDSWQGTVYANLDAVDLDAWSSWVDYPVALRNGSGAARAWVRLERGHVAGVTADLRLRDVNIRLAEQLPELAVDALGGRLEWRARPEGNEYAVRGLTFQRKGGAVIGPQSVSLRFEPARTKQSERGLLTANDVRLAPLVDLVPYLPVAESWRERLAQLEPTGRFDDVTISWEGAWPSPERYRIRGRFAQAGIRPHDAFPGLAGITGQLDASEKGGTLSLDSNASTLTLPKVFERPMRLDTLVAQADWKINKKGEADVRLSKASFANTHLAGSVVGRYQSVRGGPGVLDLNGSLSRADARYAGHYIPLVVGEHAREWLGQAFLSGHSEDVKVRIKGDLAHFPFVNDEGGVFEVRATVRDGTLRYAEKWPVIRNIQGELLFRGAHMEVTVPSGSIFGTQLTRVRAEIPDLLAPEEHLTVRGEVQGPTSEFLRFIKVSPVAQMIDHFTDDVRATGTGKLALSLDIPLRQHTGSHVGGTYQFVDNTVYAAGELPSLERVNGFLVFTQDEVRATDITARALGGPVRVSAAAKRGEAIRVQATGVTPVNALSSYVPASVVSALQGSATWKGALTLKEGQSQLVFDSDLVGVTSALPAPLGKVAATAIPLHIAHSSRKGGPDTLEFSYGSVASGQIARTRQGDQWRIDRGFIRVGDATPAANSKGLWLYAALPHLDLDRWRAVLPSSAEGASKESGAEQANPLSGVELRADRIEAFGRIVSDVQLRATAGGRNWHALISSDVVSGEVDWNADGRGKITARLKKLAIPPESGRAKEVSAAKKSTQWPAVDLAAEEFVGERGRLGRLEIQAVPQGNDWNIERLALSGPEYMLQMNGRWQAWLSRPQTDVDVKLNVRDVGAFLNRLGYADMVKRGAAEIDGHLTWNGSPADLDFASMSGRLSLHAEKGQFLKAEPGIGKLLGIVSLQSLPRRITLDFRDVFSEGFAFDTISGSMRIERGVMYSNDFQMRGPAARVQMSGETDLVHETQKLRVRVMPGLSESVSVAGALLGGPVVGLTALVVQKVLKDPIEQIAALEYSITGTWSDPKVIKLRHEAASQ